MRKLRIKRCNQYGQSAHWEAQHRLRMEHLFPHTYANSGGNSGAPEKRSGNKFRGKHVTLAGSRTSGSSIVRHDRRWHVSLATVIIVAAASVAIAWLAWTLFDPSQVSAQDPDDARGVTLSVAGQGQGGASGTTVLPLTSYAAARATALDESNGRLALEWPGSNFSAKSLGAGTVTVFDDFQIVAFEAGGLNLNGRPFDKALVVVDFESGEPIISLSLDGGTRLPVAGRTIAIDGAITMATGDQEVIVPSATAFHEDEAALSEGVAVDGMVDVTRDLGNLVDESETQQVLVEMSGSIVTDVGAFLSDGTIDTNTSFALAGQVSTANLKLPTAAGVGNNSTFGLSIEYEKADNPNDPANLTVGVNGSFDVDHHALGGEATVAAAFTVSSDRSVSMSGSFEGGAPKPFGLDGTLERIEFEADIPAQGKPSFAVLAIVDLDGTRVGASVSFADEIAGSIAVGGSIEIADGQVAAAGVTRLGSVRTALEGTRLDFGAPMPDRLADLGVQGTINVTYGGGFRADLDSQVEFGDKIARLQLTLGSKKADFKLALTVDGLTIDELTAGAVGVGGDMTLPAVTIQVNGNGNASVTGDIQIDESIRAALSTFGAPLSPGSALVVSGDLPVFDPGGDFSLRVQLPTFRPPKQADGQSNASGGWFVSATGSLTLSTTDKGISVQADVDFVVNLPTGENQVSPVTIQASASLDIGLEGVTVTFAGSVTGWNTPFGYDWLDLQNITVEISATIGPKSSVQLGIRAKVRVNNTTIDATVAIGVSAPPVKVDFGLRIFADKVHIDDVVWLVNKVNNSRINANSLPDISLQSFELSLSTIESEALCLEEGIKIGANLHIADEGSNAPKTKKLSAAEVADRDPAACAKPEPCTGDCMAGVRLEITKDGLIGEATLGSFDDLKPLTVHGASLRIALTKSEQSLAIAGDVEIEGLARAQGNLVLSSAGVEFSLTTYNESRTEEFAIYGKADFGSGFFALEVNVRSEALADFSEGVTQAGSDVLRVFGVDSDVYRVKCFAFRVQIGSSGFDPNQGERRSVGLDTMSGGFVGEIRYEQFSNRGRSKGNKKFRVEWNFDDSIPENLRRVFEDLSPTDDTEGCGGKKVKVGGGGIAGLRVGEGAVASPRRHTGISDFGEFVPKSTNPGVATTSFQDDFDGDGHIAEAFGGEDCNDRDRAIRPDVVVDPVDGRDQNCNGFDGLLLGFPPLVDGKPLFDTVRPGWSYEIEMSDWVNSAASFPVIEGNGAARVQMAFVSNGNEFVNWRWENEQGDVIGGVGPAFQTVANRGVELKPFHVYADRVQIGRRNFPEPLAGNPRAAYTSMRLVIYNEGPVVAADKAIPDNRVVQEAWLPVAFADDNGAVNLTLEGPEVVNEGEWFTNGGISGVRRPVGGRISWDANLTTDVPILKRGEDAVQTRDADGYGIRDGSKDPRFDWQNTKGQFSLSFDEFRVLDDNPSDDQVNVRVELEDRRAGEKVFETFDHRFTVLDVPAQVRSVRLGGSNRALSTTRDNLVPLNAQGIEVIVTFDDPAGRFDAPYTVHGSLGAETVTTVAAASGSSDGKVQGSTRYTARLLVPSAGFDSAADLVVSVTDADGVASESYRVPIAYFAAHDNLANRRGSNNFGAGVVTANPQGVYEVFGTTFGATVGTSGVVSEDGRCAVNYYWRAPGGFDRWSIEVDAFNQLGEPIDDNVVVTSAANGRRFGSDVGFSTSPGDEMIIQVNTKTCQGDVKSTGPFVLRIVPAGPANDLFEDATPLSSGVALRGSTVRATQDEGDLGSQTTSSWWYFNAPDAGHFEFSTEGSAIDTTLAVYRGKSPNTGFNRLEYVGSNDDAEVGRLFHSEALVDASLSNDRTYFLSVSGFNGREGAVVVKATPLAPPNDDPTSAVSLSLVDGRASVEGTTVRAERRGNDKWVWYEFRPLDDTAVRVRVTNKDGAANNLRVVDLFNSNGSTDIATGSGSRVELAGGTTYYIAVGGPLSDPAGGFTLQIDKVGPPNDDVANATPLNGRTNVDNRRATSETAEPSHAGATAGPSVWYRWTAPTKGTFEVSVESDSFAPTVAVYRDRNSGAEFVTADAQVASGTARAGFVARNGVTYLLAVTSVDGGTGTGTIAIAQVQDLEPPEPDPDPGEPKPGDVVCGGLVATIVGTPGDDVLRGTSGPDVIAGLGGNDKIFGKGGDDVICGGDGKDRITGGGGNDTIYGGNSNDRLKGGKGKDTLFGEKGNDKLFGGNGRDKLSGGAGKKDLLDGDKGKDTCSDPQTKTTKVVQCEG